MVRVSADNLPESAQGGTESLPDFVAELIEDNPEFSVFHFTSPNVLEEQPTAFPAKVVADETTVAKPSPLEIDVREISRETLKIIENNPGAKLWHASGEGGGRSATIPPALRAF